MKVQGELNMDHEIISEIAGLCIKVSQRTKHDAFFRYAGHVNAVTVDIHENGWVKGSEPESFDISIHEDYETLLLTVYYKLTNLLLSAGQA